MTHEDFEKLLNELEGTGSATLAEKNARYSSSDDALHNFKAGAEIMGGTPAQTCWGYLTKHLTALRDMIEKDNFSNREDFLEKCQDSINYIRFIWALGNENTFNYAEQGYPFFNSDGDTECCLDCAHIDHVSRDAQGNVTSVPCKDCKNTAIVGTEEYNNRHLLFQWPKEEKEENNS